MHYTHSVPRNDKSHQLGFMPVSLALTRSIKPARLKEIKIFLTDICLKVRKCKPVSTQCIEHINVTNNKHTFSTSHGAIARTINMLCIAIVLKGMEFFDCKSWLGLNEYIRLYERRRPWVFLIPAAQDIACLEVLQASERTLPLLLWESKHQTAKISILFPPEPRLSQCGDEELMVQAGHREGSWCRTCSSPTSSY